MNAYACKEVWNALCEGVLLQCAHGIANTEAAFISHHHRFSCTYLQLHLYLHGENCQLPAVMAMCVFCYVFWLYLF